MPNDDIDIERILAAGNIKHVAHYGELPSTNDLAIELATRGETACPFLVIAERQTSGRGRGENKWWAGLGAITASLVIDTHAEDIPPAVWPKLSLTVGLAVCQTLEELVPRLTVRLKWPNDVYLQGRKVCGILVETTSSQANAIVIGVGVNVNNSLEDAPAELQATATSLADEAHRDFDRTAVLLQMLARLAELTPTIRRDDSSLSEAFRQRCLLEGRTLTVQVGNRSVSGVCHGIDHEGALLVRSESGLERCFGGVVSQIL